MNFGYSDFRLRTCELKAPQCFLIEQDLMDRRVREKEKKKKEREGENKD